MSSYSDFRLDIQGLRGIAVLLVVLFHAGLLSSGFIGVDIFFVISGFVVSQSLLRGIDKTRKGLWAALRAFYVRRVARILPAFSLAVCGSALAGVVFSPIGGLDLSLQTARAGLLLVSNVFLYRKTTGYFTLGVEDNAFLHLWSLSVEEQFYLSFPLLLLIAIRLSMPRGPWGIPLLAISAATVCSFLVAVVFSFEALGSLGVVDSPLRFSFFAPVSRAWEFGVGAILAILKRDGARFPVPRLIGSVGLTLLTVALLSIRETTAFPGWIALLPALGTAGLIAAGGGRSWVAGRALLEWRPFVWMGDLSYGWYLWHWPIMIFVRAWFPSSPGVILLAGIGSLLPAWGSYWALEKRLRIQPRDSDSAVSRKFRWSIGVGLVSLAAVVGVQALLEGSSHPSVAWTEQMAAHLDLTEGCDESRSVPPGKERPSCLWEADDGAEEGTIFLIGDSNAGQFSEAVVLAADSLGYNAEIHTHSDCPLVLHVSLEGLSGYPLSCSRFANRVLERMAALPPSMVFFSSSLGYLRPDGWERAGSASVWEGGDESAVRLMSGTRNFLQALSEGGHTIVLLEEVPKSPQFESGRCSALQVWWAFDWYCTYSTPRSTVAEKVNDSRQFWEHLSRSIPGSVVEGFFEQLCPFGTCSSHRGNTALWRDGDHISVAASEALSGEFIRLVRRVRDRR